MERHGYRNWNVYAHHSNLNLITELTCAVTIGCKDGRSIAVFVCVDQANLNQSKANQ